MAVKRHDPEFHKAKLLEALEKHLGIVSQACAEVGISRKMFYEYYKLDPEFKSAVDELDELTLDFVENQLLKKIKEGSEKSIMFYMRYKARKRGYTDAMQIDMHIKEFKAKFPGLGDEKEDDVNDN